MHSRSLAFLSYALSRVLRHVLDSWLRDSSNTRQTLGSCSPAVGARSFIVPVAVANFPQDASRQMKVRQGPDSGWIIGAHRGGSCYLSIDWIWIIEAFAKAVLQSDRDDRGEPVERKRTSPRTRSSHFRVEDDHLERTRTYRTRSRPSRSSQLSQRRILIFIFFFFVFSSSRREDRFERALGGRVGILGGAFSRGWVKFSRGLGQVRFYRNLEERTRELLSQVMGIAIVWTWSSRPRRRFKDSVYVLSGWVQFG